MHLVAEFADDEAVKHAQLAKPLGPGFPADIAEKAAKLEVRGTQFSDPGPDKTVFKLYDAQGDVIGKRELAGY